ncbi:MAG: metallophosphoesterase [Clostridia bacterium]|nr:metallophosphoesterase [Clostridia bacterium]
MTDKTTDFDLTGPFARVFVTGDIHGDVEDLADRVKKMGAKNDDLVVILGDCGFFYDSYFEREGRVALSDVDRTKKAAALPCTILCVQGNHEVPYDEMPWAKEVSLLGGEGYYAYGVYFAKNGTTLDLNGKKALVLGGAVSIDRFIREQDGRPWFSHEEVSSERFEEIVRKVRGGRFDFVFSHTTPLSDIPEDGFADFPEPYYNGHHTEKYLQRVKENIAYGCWYAGHYHLEREYEKLHILYRNGERIV